MSKPPVTQVESNAATPPTNGRQRGVRHEAQTEASVSPIEAAKQLREVLRDALAKNTQLIHALRRQQKQSKAVAATLASLKELQKLSA